MGQSSEKYIEMVSVEFEKEKFDQICQSNGLQFEIDYKIKNVEVPEYPYEENKKWQQQKTVSTKEFKKLKQIEFEIRQKTVEQA